MESLCLIFQIINHKIESGFVRWPAGRPVPLAWPAGEVLLRRPVGGASFLKIAVDITQMLQKQGRVG
jgi:hypothetical protein